MKTKIELKDKIFHLGIEKFKFFDFSKIFKNIIDDIKNLFLFKSKIENFFILEPGENNLCFVNFKKGKWNIEGHANDLMLAKFHHHGWRTTVRWINGMSVTIPTENLQEAFNIQQINIAASTGNSSRITPNPEKGSEKDCLRKCFEKALKGTISNYDINCSFENFFENFQKIKNRANGETPIMDNPVASLDNLEIDFLVMLAEHQQQQFFNKSYSTKLTEIKFKLQNARTTDKERPLLNNYEYRLICKLLNKEGINSGRIFYVLNRMVDDTV